jgi:hypothetical protein
MRAAIVFISIASVTVSSFARADNISDLAVPNATNTAGYRPGQVWNCSAGNKNTCSGNGQYIVPGGYQMCKITFRGDTNNEASFTLTPINFFDRDPENPPRFLGFRARISAAGGQSLIFPYGSHVNISELKIWAIPANLGNAERFARGCWLTAKEWVSSGP